MIIYYPLKAQLGSSTVQQFVSMSVLQFYSLSVQQPAWLITLVYKIHYYLPADRFNSLSVQQFVSSTVYQFYSLSVQQFVSSPVQQFNAPQAHSTVQHSAQQKTQQFNMSDNALNIDLLLIRKIPKEMLLI